LASLEAVAGTVIYDADCGFCTTTAEWLRRHGGCGLQPWQTLDLEPLGLTEDDVRNAAYWMDGSGRVTARGAGAIAEALQTCHHVWRLAGHVVYARPMRPVADRVYVWVARNRHRLPGSTDACKLEQE
jgi:predicted DCC family thiol-disulfide oxidoreductase YuxK